MQLLVRLVIGVVEICVYWVLVTAFLYLAALPLWLGRSLIRPLAFQLLYAEPDSIPDVLLSDRLLMVSALVAAASVMVLLLVIARLLALEIDRLDTEIYLDALKKR